MRTLFITLIIALFLSSCDFLDVVPDDTTTLEDAFKNESEAENFLFGCYSFLTGNVGGGFNNFRDSFGMMNSNEQIGAYHWGAQWFKFMSYNEGLDNSSDPRYNYWEGYYQGIHQSYIFLENIDNVVPVNMNPDVFEKHKANWKGEARYLIAFYHHMLFQHYGSVVLVHNKNNDSHPRSSVDECVTTIGDWYDQAAELLLDKQPTSAYGRATKTMSKSLKAKLLLYSASPLFNGDVEYAKLKNKDGSDLFPQTSDKNKWKLAMDAAKAAIDDAHSAGLKLYEWTGADPITDGPITDPFRQAYLNTRYMIVDNKAWSTEFIVPFTKKEGSDGFQRHAVPHGLADRPNTVGNPVGALSPTLAAVKIFYTANGLAPESDKSFDWNNRMKVPENEETCILHLNREPRFYAAIGYDRGMYEFNGYGTEYKLRLKCGNGAENSSLTGGGLNPEPNGCIGPDRRGNDHLYAGYANKKLVKPDGQANASGWGYQDYMWPILRLSDLYLMYIEACGEYTGSLDSNAKTYLTAIHKRAGVPDTYHSATGKELQTSIHRERMIELIFEGHWVNDLRRWKKAEEWYKNDRDGMWGLNEMGQNEKDFYQEVRCTNQPYRFDKKYYLMPIKLSFLNINGNLVQNPGY